jgi:hypothetical protein
MAILLLTSVNLLLIVVNYVDIKCLWFGFNPPNNFCFKDFVHEGTEVLIASIVLAMFIILYFFRMNLNFIPKNKMLVLLANIWLLQNLILTISVALRNYYYINFHALAYKRIGVAFFLILVTVGLISIFIKVNYKKSGYYLWRINSWTIYFLVVILSLINWNELIVQYNLKHWSKKDVDVDFYFQLSPNISNYLIDNRATIQQQIIANQQANHNWLENKSKATFDSTLTIRHTEYLNKIKNDAWQSWNYMDYKYLKQIKNHEAHI